MSRAATSRCRTVASECQSRGGGRATHGCRRIAGAHVLICMLACYARWESCPPAMAVRTCGQGGSGSPSVSLCVAVRLVGVAACGDLARVLAGGRQQALPPEVRRGAWWGRGEISGGGGSFKKKKKER